ncbi:TQO small subunit DoxD [Helicobacter sp. 11S02629-2]|uniref:TQO small subunit DoxD n=1 Tax=Helicobacter sp. 11S02629-2 TaxID=1476195 RepID=UPI000BA716E3|nr:TQO small subunit DoxD [Helicobacter sp. 11S02629-2]PAF43120.1 quinol oxidase [Helicobacter sp. 11S02629-2]
MKPYTMAGYFSLALRLVVGWTYFSAFWRRTVLADKLNPESAGYIGEKINHFLPHALWIQGMIEYFITHASLLLVGVIFFTIVEGVVGLFLILGLFTRIMSIAAFILAFVILLGAGWMGSTCLDEWQIGILGMAGAIVIFFAGGGVHAIDNLLLKSKALARSKAFIWIASGELPLSTSGIKIFSGILAIVMIVVTIGTNQYFSGGVIGKLHNKTVHPHIMISKVNIANNALNFTIFRDEGPDTYGAFIVDISLKDASGTKVYELNQEALSKLPKEDIKNELLVKVHPGKHSLVAPLAARAALSLKSDIFASLPKGEYTLVITDISGMSWKANYTLN